jgi:hypothetical protein
MINCILFVFEFKNATYKKMILGFVEGIFNLNMTSVKEKKLRTSS